MVETYQVQGLTRQSFSTFFDLLYSQGGTLFLRAAVEPRCSSLWSPCSQTSNRVGSVKKRSVEPRVVRSNQAMKSAGPGISGAGTAGNWRETSRSGSLPDSLDPSEAVGNRLPGGSFNVPCLKTLMLIMWSNCFWMNAQQKGTCFLPRSESLAILRD